MKRIILAVIVVLAFTGTSYAATCKSYKKCSQAVKAWCAGNHPGGGVMGLAGRNAAQAVLAEEKSA